MDGPFYNDLKQPFDIANNPPGAVTLATTDKALYTTSEIPPYGSGYWWPGKMVRIRAAGKATTGTTPGNGTFSLYWGTGADANGTILGASSTVALAASQSNLSWLVDLIVECTVRGSSGKLQVSGFALLGGLLSTNIPLLIPASSMAPSSAIDLTASNILSLQFKRSGSTAETMQVLSLQHNPMD